MKRLMQYAISLMAAALCVMLLVWGDAVRQGVREGLSVCAQVLIPSLYLFMAVAGCIAQSPAGAILSAPLAPVMRRVFRLPACLGPAVALSCIGGYPVGAKTIAVLLEEGGVTREQAQRAICFCCNAGPSFVVTAVGAGMLGSAKMGAVLLAAHLLASFFIGWLTARRAPPPEKNGASTRALPFSRAFIAGVNGATSGMLAICAFTVFFSALGSLLRSLGIPQTARAAAVGFLEVTAGCVAASELPGRLPLLMLPVFISFGGLSVAFQIAAVLDPFRLDLRPFFFSRVLHAALTLALAYPFLSRFTATLNTFGSSAVPVGYHTPNTFPATVLLLLVCACVLLRLTGGENPK